MNRAALSTSSARGALAAFALLGFQGCATTPTAPAPEELAPATPRRPTIAAKVLGLERRSGLVDLYLDEIGGKVWLALPPAAPDGTLGTYLYLEGITTGLGSNPVGLDRGQSGDTVLLTFRRVGEKVLALVDNQRYRALSDDPHELRAVEESFADGAVWAGEIAATDAAGRTLVDFTSFLLRDAHGIAERLTETGQGSYTLDRERSAVALEGCLAFPRNVELESILTFAGGGTGNEVRAVAATPEALTFVLHQSLVELPPTGYRPRAYDPRLGSFAIAFADYAVDLDRPIEQRWIARHRLEKVDPTSPRSAVKEPIVYYVDRGAPEPVRSALVEGAAWWAEAFAAAGFVDAYRVELLPEGAHPLDVRYNVIQWVHRATRGWSYGGGVIDPRSGEIVKGQVTLGSLRIRQDRLLFEGLLGTAATGSGRPDDPIELSLARIRQLSAHEVGHTLGLAHNFAASSYGRASVMDYPAPLVRVTADGRLDVSEAYGRGLGAWDRHAIRWAYSETPPGTDEVQALGAIADEGIARGMLFFSDSDARAPGTAVPSASLWDNGEDAVDALLETLRVRELALARFGEGNLAIGSPRALLEEVLVPVYLHHRFQLTAAAKTVGGVHYRHALRGDGQPGIRPISGSRQRRALRAVVETLAPSFLDLPERLLQWLVPRPPEVERSREQFAGRTGVTFDPLSAAASAADMTVRLLLHPERAARLVDFSRRDPDLPALEEVIGAIVEQAWADPALLSPREAEIQRVVQRVVVDRLIALAQDSAAPPWVSSRVEGQLSQLLNRVDPGEAIDATEKAHLAALAAEVGRHLARPSAPASPAMPAPPEPPGEPIGSDGRDLAASDSECAFAARASG